MGSCVIPRKIQNCLILIFILGQVFLGFRSLFLDDGQFGWGIFPYLTEYRVQYFWKFADGKEQPYLPGSELKGISKRYLSTSDKHFNHNGVGTVRRHLQGYLDYLAERPPALATAIRAVLYYQVNRNGKTVTEHFETSASVPK